MRRRNDLYYVERLNTDIVLHEDGRAGDVVERNVERTVTVKGRREDRPRRIRHTFKSLEEAETYDNVAELLVHRQAEIRAKNKQYGPSDDSWTLEDMPDTVIERYEAWDKNASQLITGDVFETASNILQAAADMGEDADTTIACPYCKNSDPKYACRACNYSRNYYKYPVVRFAQKSEPTNIVDIPFNVAEYLKRYPDRLTYENELIFDSNGEMRAIKYAVVNTGDVDMEHISTSDLDDKYEFDSADSISGGIRVAIDFWSENPGRAHLNYSFNHEGSLTKLINEFQRKLAVEIERESTDTEHYQQEYDKLMHGVRTLGKGAIDIMIRSHYEGMGETGFEMTFQKLPYIYDRTKTVAYDSCIRWLIEKAVQRFDFENNQIDLRYEGGY